MQYKPRQDGKGINYCFADMIGIRDFDYRDDRLMIPSIAVRELMEELLLSVGKTVVFSSAIQPYINKMYIPFNSDYKELTNEWEFAKYESIESSLATKDKGLNIIKSLRCEYEKIQDIATETTTSRNNISIVNNIGTYKVTLVCSVKKTADIPDVDTPEVKPKILINTSGIFKTQLEELELINTGVNPDDGIFLTDTNYHQAIFEGFFTVQGGFQSLYIGFDTDELPDGEGPLLNNPDGTTSITIKKLDSFYNEDQEKLITSDNILPVNYKKIDFFNDVISLFNGVVTSIGDELTIRTINEYNAAFNPVHFDWSGYILDESNIETKTLLEANPEIQEFEFLDSDDLYLSDYKSKYGTGMSYLKRFSDIKTVIKNKLNFSASTMLSYNAPLNDDFVSLMASDGEYNTKLTPRILFVNYLESLPSMLFGLDSQGARDRSINYFPILSTRFNSDLSDVDNMSISFENKDTYRFGGSDINGTIFNKFYSNNEALTSNDDLIFLTSDFNISPKDFSDVNFNDIIFIEAGKYGSGNFRLNEIPKFIAGGNKLTNAELIQVDIDLLNTPDFESSEIVLNYITLSDGAAENKSKLAFSGVTSSEYDNTEDAIEPEPTPPTPLELPLTATMTLTPDTVSYGDEGIYTITLNISNSNAVTVDQLILWRWKKANEAIWINLLNVETIVTTSGLILSESVQLDITAGDLFQGYVFEAYVLGNLEKSINIIIN
jgi:hypothetical protein